MDELISRQAAIDALGERPLVWTDDDEYTLGQRNQYDMDRLAIETVPSVESEIAKEISKDAADVMESVVRIARALAEILESGERKDDEGCN